VARRKRTVDITDVLDEMPTEFVVCRDLHHSWDPYTAFKIKGGWDDRLRCSKCGTIRSRILDDDGFILSARYEYADGYRIKGLGYLSAEDRSMVRLRSVKSRQTPRATDA